MISATVRYRLKPCLPVQQAQSSAQPACVHTHTACRDRPREMNTVHGIMVTDVIRNLRVPSSESLSETTAGGRTVARARSFLAQTFGMLSWHQNQQRRNDGSNATPAWHEVLFTRSANQAVSAAGSRSRRFCIATRVERGESRKVVAARLTTHD